jgi:hypothetical protein
MLSRGSRTGNPDEHQRSFTNPNPPLRPPCDASPFRLFLARNLRIFTKELSPPSQPLCGLCDLCAMLSPFRRYSHGTSESSPKSFRHRPNPSVASVTSVRCFFSHGSPDFTEDLSPIPAVTSTTGSPQPALSHSANPGLSPSDQSPDCWLD